MLKNWFAFTYYFYFTKKVKAICVANNFFCFS